MDEERKVRPLGKVLKSEGAAEATPLVGTPAPSAAGGRGVVLTAEAFQAHGQARHLLAEARQEAEAIRAEARAFRDRVFAEAREAARAEVQAREVEVLARAKLQAGAWLAEAEPRVVDLALALAARIIGRELERDPSALVELCAAATESARASRALTLRVHPDDARTLRQERPRLLEAIGRSVDVSIRDDADVERGGCVIQTEAGTIDAQLRTQLQMLREVLLDEARPGAPR